MPGGARSGGGWELLKGRGGVLLRLAIPAVVRHQQIGAGLFSNTVDLFDGSVEHEHSPVAPTVQSLV